MTLRSQIEQSVVDAFSKLDSVLCSIDYHSFEKSEYNTDSGRVDKRDKTNSPQSLKIPMYNAIDERIETGFESAGSNKRKIERKCIIVQSELLFTPTESDIIKHKNQNNRVVTIEEDPASIVWILGLVSGG